jgi:hypothetical protein
LFSAVSGIWLTTGDVLFFCEKTARKLRKVATHGIIYMLQVKILFIYNKQGINGAGDGEVTTASSNVKLSLPTGGYVESTGAVFIADNLDGRVRRIDSPTGIIHTFAGEGSNTTLGIAATSCNLELIFDVKGNTNGNIYVSGTFFR